MIILLNIFIGHKNSNLPFLSNSKPTSWLVCLNRFDLDFTQHRNSPLTAPSPLLRPSATPFFSLTLRLPSSTSLVLPPPGGSHISHQFISINTCTSSTAPLSQGVPQGSILGPLLFILYMLSIGNIIHFHSLHFHCYAHDPSLHLRSLHADQLPHCNYIMDANQLAQTKL